MAVALALLCLASVSSAQDNSDSTDSPSTSVPTRTSQTRATSASSRDTPSQTEDNTRSADTATAKETDTTEDDTDSNGSELANEPDPTDDGSNTEDGNSNDEEPTQSFDESYEETGLAGAVTLTTPDIQAIGTPMFVIGEKITLGWEYSKSTLRPPKKVSICGKFPKDSGKSVDRTAICDWDIAVNISGSLKKYTWDTLTGGARGVAFSEDTGYFMYLYDSDYGITNNLPGAGRITPYSFSFGMYNSRYGQTNNGVPVGYSPSSNAHGTEIHALAIACAVLLSIVGILM
ncbi:hypothetical protein LPJ64_001032 [Coemansia asiatica]|uniref:DUF7137 domain-containing protein n=1 Tax=Coemansia asiatica TaxID=1052880 RepID=A0A9W7XLZ7_9FUNG|nr:hypothetical protein LPJ64_001032 [Coemansia asiatica]KAJ2877544.1 hypothetical protein FB639_003710 [Coemansia asiatica]